MLHGSLLRKLLMEPMNYKRERRVTMMSVKSLVDKFVCGVINESDYESLDRNYLKNRVLNLVGEENIPAAPETDDLIELKNQLVQVAVQNQKIGDTANEQDNLGAELMDFITPTPSALSR